MRIINAMVRALATAGVPPNLLTTIGVCITWAAPSCRVRRILLGRHRSDNREYFRYAGRQCCPATGNVTKFGGFLDSSLDRLSDMVAFLGIMIFYAGNSPQHSLLNVTLAGVGMIASVMVSYTTPGPRPGCKGERRISAAAGTNSALLSEHSRHGLEFGLFLFNECRRCCGFSPSGQWDADTPMYYIWTEFIE